ncbi:MAG TPA: energy transducer TonB [Bryobacteraceae bacterium]|nr:energy transducer TonB [Bryobacteraceae bacterium]
MSIREFHLDPEPDYQSLCGDGITLRFRVTALQSLRALVHKGAERPNMRGLEVGGLLLGSKTSDIRVEAVDAITIDHRFGPSYELSDADFEFYLRTIAEMRIASELRILGHFRSHSRGEPAITPADLTIAQLIGPINPLVLLVKSSQTEPSLARLYRKSGEGCVELLAFSLGRSIGELPVMQPVETPADGTLPPAPARAVEPRPPVPLASRDLPAVRRAWKTCLLVGLVAFAVLLFYFVRPKASRPGPRADIGIGLAVRREGEGLTVNWNGSSPEIHNAISGVLIIQDGTVEHRFQLTPESLRSTKFFYAPQTAGVQVRLEVYHERGRFNGETVTVDTGVRQSVVEPPKQPRTEVRTFQGTKTVVRSLHAEKKRIPAGPRSTRARNSNSDEKRKPALTPAETPRPRVRDFRMPGFSTPAIVGPVELEPPPILRLPPSAGLAPPIRPDLPDAFAPSPAPASTPPISYVAAVSVRKASPAISDGLRSLIPDKLTVEVKVRIDAEGNVTSATPVNTSNSTQKLLAPSAVQASMLWLFAPARRNGQAVESEAVLRFDFERRAR